MQKLDQYNDNLGVAILLTGTAGAGKTVLACRLFPKSYIFVADPNFKSGKDYLAKHNLLSNVVGFDTATPDEYGKPVAPNMRFTRMLKCINEALKSPEVDCIVIDSTTFIEDLIKAKIANAATDDMVKLDGFKQWGDLLLTWKSLIIQLRQSGKKCIMTAHEKKEKDESDQMFKYKIAVDGQISDKFPSLFSDVWRCEVVEQGIGATAKHIWQVRTLSNQRQEHLKRSSQFADLPAVLPADDLVKAVQK